MNDDDFNLEEEVAALFELWDDQDFAVKVGPEVGPNADALTSLTRGRGPRRGNLEDLLKYWRPIMKKPGGFRRCVVILMDKPKFGGKPQRICAWLHHEITGKWPNEGKGKKKRGSGRRRGPRTGSVRRAGRRLKTADIFESEIMFMPLDGSQEMVDYKAKASVIPNVITTPRALGPVGTSATAAVSFALPGDLSDLRSPVRSAIFEALTPGPPGRGGRRGVVGGGSGARNKFRCPPGFQAGGTFTNSNFSTCGLRVLGIPSGGPGAFQPEVASAVRELADDADLRRSVGDLRTNRNARAIIENSQIPAAPKEVSIGNRQASIDLIVSLIDADPNADFGRRFVRRDGVILDLVLPNDTLAGLGEFDDMNDGVIVLNENLREEAQIGQEIIPVMGTGLRAVVFHVPGQGTMSLRRVGGDLTDDERNGLAAAWAASLTSSQRRSSDPTAALRNFAENSDGRYTLDENISSGGAGEDAESAFNRELVVVENGGGGKITVPRWVYELYLSREAPRREEGDAVYSLVEEATKMAELSRFSVVKQDVVPDATFDRHGWSEAAERVALFNEVKGIGGKAGRAIPDPSGKFRCPVGTGGGGQFTNSGATTCGARLAENLIESLYDTGRSLRVPDHEVGKGTKRKKPVRTPKDNQVVDSLRAGGKDIDDVMESVAVMTDAMRESVQAARNAGLENQGGLGSTIGQAAPDRAALSIDDAFMLQGDALVDALADVQDLVSAPEFADADQPLRLEVFGLVEDLANMEAARRGVAESGDREIGHQRLFDTMMNETLVSVAPGSDTGDSRTVGTAQSVRRFAGSELLSDMPESESSTSLDDIDEPDFFQMREAERELETDDMFELEEVSDWLLENSIDIPEIKRSAERLAVEQRGMEDRDARVAKVNAFLDAKYPEGVERPWKKWQGRGDDIMTMSREEREALVTEMWSLGVEIPGGEYTVKGPGGDKRVRMTITPVGEYLEKDAGYATTIGFFGSFNRNFYDVETGQLLGTQNAGEYERNLLVDPREGAFEAGHEYMTNVETIKFTDNIGLQYTGGTVTGAGLAKELNYPAYAYYEALSPNAKVYLSTAASGPWIWPRQGVNEVIKAGSQRHSGAPMEPVVEKFVGVADSDVFDTRLDAFGADFYDNLAQALVAPTPEHRERLRELGVAFNEGGFTNRDVQLAMENPVDGVDSSDMVQISRSMMVTDSALSTEIRNREFFGRNRGPVLRVLEASGVQVGDQSFMDWYGDLSDADKDVVVMQAVRKMNLEFNDLGLKSGYGRISNLIDTASGEV